MSMAMCDCGNLVDTDDDCEFYDFGPKTTDGFGGHCHVCREAIMESMTKQEMEEHERRICG